MDLMNPKYDGGQFEALPAGVYLAHIDNLELKKTKDKTKDMYVVKYKLVEGPEDNPIKNTKNRIVFENFVTTVDWRMGNLRNLVLASGIDDQEILKNFDQKFGQVIDRTVRIRLKVVPRNDNPEVETNEVVPDNYYKYEGPPIPDSVSGEKKEKPTEVKQDEKLPFEN
jgi:hypothetical protein